MAVHAHRQVINEQAALIFVHVAQAPGDEGQRRGGQRLDDAALELRGHERHVAEEDGRADGIFGGAEGDAARGDDPVRLERAVALNDDGGGLLDASALDLFPLLAGGTPRAGGRFLRGHSWQLVRIGDGAVVDLAGLEPARL